MSNRIILFFCFSLVLAVECFYRDNITDFTGCKMHVSRSESSYSVFYEIDNTLLSKWYLLDLHFSVLASSNAHILITETENGIDNMPVYEIVLGAGSNKYSDIRRKIRNEAKATASTVGILSSIDYRSFWIRIWTDGLIEVGNENDNTTFLAWIDNQPLKVKYFSFGTWTNVNARWFFDCKEKINEIDPANITSLTIPEKLRRDLFQNYNKLARPVLDETTITDVLLHLIPQYVSLDERTSKLSIKGIGHMQWIDEKLKWNPKNYDDIKTIKLSVTDIWAPNLKLHDQKIDFQDIFLHYNGSVAANILMDTKYWCNMENLNLWPYDTHNCSLPFIFDNDGGKIRWLYLSEEQEFFKQPGLASEWIVINSKIDLTFPLDLDEYTDYDQVYSASGLILKLTLKRLSNVYKLIFLPPFFVISICCLCSFWTPAFGYQKIFLGCIQLIIESSILIYISSILPGHSSKVPKLISLYSGCLVSTAISIFMSIIVINISRNKHINYIPEWLQKVLSSNYLQKSLFLPRIQNEDGKTYLSDNVVKTNCNQERMKMKAPHLVANMSNCVVPFLLLLGFSSQYSYQNIFTDFRSCKMTVTSEQYNVFHEIENDSRCKWFLFDLHFSVLAESDAHILISETKNIDKNVPVYEIVLGAGSNTYSTIRKGLKSLEKATKSRVGILSSAGYRSFWIRIWTDYLIEVGCEGNNTAFLSWKDDNPLKLKYFSFASYNNIPSKWFYDCKEKINEPNYV
ncbi:Farnesoic acid 0-methyl transferase [Popillia japonica]|uniref:Farnesoic acid 0-methyl transferase n=1 Tax=Popillia japonica TaxID=7064 RepID=A0AAW1L555_POPJA